MNYTYLKNYTATTCDKHKIAQIDYILQKVISMTYCSNREKHIFSKRFSKLHVFHLRYVAQKSNNLKLAIFTLFEG